MGNPLNPAGPSSPLNTVWSQPLPDALQGVVLARERGAILVWDENRTLYLFDQRGDRRAQTQLSQPVACACAADDGSTFVAIDSRGEVHWLADDLSTKRRHSLNMAPLTAILDAYGQYLVVSGQKTSLIAVDRRGIEVARLHPPRACRHLAAAASRDYFVGCADYGFVGAFDLLGNWLWRDGLVVHISAIALGGDGSPLVLACFSEGIQTYNASGKKQPRWSLPQPIKTTATSFDGKTTFAGGSHHHIFQLNQAGQLQHDYRLTQSISSLVCSPLGDYVVFTATDKTLNKAKIGHDS